MGKKYLLFAAIGLLFVRTASAATQTNRYVVKGNVNAAPPYDTEFKAAANIQDAINAAVAANGDQVLVAAATYDSGGTNVSGLGLTNRVYISKAITVRSINNDPTNTIIRGAWHPVTTNGTAAIRCVYMVANATLSGFTLTNGATIAAGNGGGAYSESATATISNCVITGCSADGDGGGARQGTYFNCTFMGNSTPRKGGAADNAVFSNCTLSGNSAVDQGGGAYRGTLYGCLVSNNYAGSSGGGIASLSTADPCRLYDCTLIGNISSNTEGGVGDYGMLYNCTIAFNVALGMGGGAWGSTLINCLVVSNRASSYAGCVGGNIRSNCFILGASLNGKYWNCLIGGSVSSYGVAGSPVLYNCTVVGNKNAGITDGCSVFNCISWGNGSPDQNVLATNSCGVASANNNYANALVGNTTNDPMFRVNGSGLGTNLIPGNYRLQANSPCVNRGTNQAWMTDKVDLDGRIRIRYGTVDMGAYETIYDGTIYKCR